APKYRRSQRAPVRPPGKGDTHMSKWALIATILAGATPALAQYSPTAAQNAPKEDVTVARPDGRGGVTYVHEKREPARDPYGNAAGNQFDLAVDGAFEGQTVAVLHFYTQESFDFHLPKAALAQKGF